MGQIKVTSCPIEGLYVIEPTVHGDARGWFMEVYNQNDLKEAGIDRVFVQENESCSEKGVLRGLHFQKQFPQAKLARVLRGAVFDVAVDLRRSSKTYGQWYGVELSEENRKMFYIPEGFAHGLLSLTDGAIFCYKCTDFYHPGDEGGILWNDPEVGVRWPQMDMPYLGVTDFAGLHMADGTPIKLSEKDKNWLPLRETFSF
ncbi:MAG: dTDP-4-dehydrorhamnose 3,5-epimerase [Oscillospiraceae bacterium]|nr:dTDP-4-dehydrorhamnose 3,5-epimerase [Oscillospiraceae bacterium]